MKIGQTGTFSRTIKKLHGRDKTAVDKAVRKIAANTGIGAMKKGVLAGARVHKFKVADKQYLLAYRHEKKSDSVTLLALGQHENFYRDLSKQ